MTHNWKNKLVFVSFISLFWSNLSAQNSDSLIYKTDTIIDVIDCIYIVEQIAEFPGGDTALRNFIKKNLVYPKEAQKLGQMGKVFVRFVILEDGSVDQESVKVLRGEFELLNQEAIRVIKSMPKWKPGKQSGKPVKNQFTLPIIFKL